MTAVRKRVVLLVGGVGGAKLALGLARVLPPDALTIIVNTADDFDHLGLHISPDVDTVMYTLADLVNKSTGWGLAEDTTQAMSMVDRYGGPTWFKLGDKDLGTHLMRTRWLREGFSLTDITRKLCAALSVQQTLLPMTNDPVRTMLDTDQGILSFQEYFVREGWQPVVRQIRYTGSEQAASNPDVALALDRATLIVFGPSNPFLSLDPILSIAGVRGRIEQATVPRVAISPIIAGQAVKGPTAKLMTELDVDISPVGVAAHYQGLLDGILVDHVDQALCKNIEDSLGLRTTTEAIFMKNETDKIQLAEALLSWVEDSNH